MSCHGEMRAEQDFFGRTFLAGLSPQVAGGRQTLGKQSQDWRLGPIHGRCSAVAPGLGDGSSPLLPRGQQGVRPGQWGGNCTRMI